VLERKLAAAGEAGGNSGRSALRALRLALARIAKNLYDLPLAVIGAKQVRCDYDGVSGHLTDDWLLVLLDGSNGQAGAVSLDRACVAALTQQLTMGCITGTAMGDRAFTGTDAALAEPLIEAWVSRAAELADLPEDQRCLSGFRFGARVGDVRSLILALEADRFRVFDLVIDIGEGAMQGAICLILPDPPADLAQAGTKGADTLTSGPRMEQSFGVMRADLTAIIGRLRLPLTELAAMQPGDVLPLVRERLEKTELVTITGQAVAAGRLGQINGLWALRLNETFVSQGQLDRPDENGFGNKVVVTQPDADGPLTLGGPVMPDPEELEQQAGLPALIGQAETLSATSEPEGESDNLLDRMTPEEAAAEISQLAGLNVEDAVE